jgi:hypothetical protein
VTTAVAHVDEGSAARVSVPRLRLAG